MVVNLCKTLNTNIAGTVILADSAWRMKVMIFRKTGVVPVHTIRCSCGHEIKGSTDACPGCGKTLIPKELQTVKEEKPEDDQKLNN